MRETYSVPEIRRKPKIERPKAIEKPSRPEPALEMGEYENILSILKNMVLVWKEVQVPLQIWEKKI